MIKNTAPGYGVVFHQTDFSQGLRFRADERLKEEVFAFFA